MRRAALPLAPVTTLVLLLAACGTGTTGSAGGTTSPSATATVVVVTRTGGLAGVNDTLRLEGSGSVTITARDGSRKRCQVDRAVARRLRAVDLGSLGPPPGGGRRVADGYVYRVRAGGQEAVVSDGETSGRRAELVDAAAAVFAACGR